MTTPSRIEADLTQSRSSNTSKDGVYELYPSLNWAKSQFTLDPGIVVEEAKDVAL
jgi:hypothetical protein